jgi:hypothetical protein
MCLFVAVLFGWGALMRRSRVEQDAVPVLAGDAACQQRQAV